MNEEDYIKESNIDDSIAIQVYNVENRPDGTIKIEIFDSKLLDE
mgnify:FL=1